MSNPIAREAGVVDAVFAHRFVLKRTDGSKLLADLGAKGATAYRLVEGAVLSIEGEAKPSEIKVSRLTPQDGEPIVIPHGKPHKADDVDPSVALSSVKRSGLEPVGEPRRKPKHFEVLARRGLDLVEVHVELDGKIRKEKAADETKWAEASRSN